LPWLWIGPSSSEAPTEGRGLRLMLSTEGWSGPIRCRLPLPIASESLGAVVLQHVASLRSAGSGALLAECTRALVPGGRLHVLALNPLSPYRLRWQGRGLRAADAAGLRQLLRDVGLNPEPFAQGVGPQWSMRSSELPQAGLGLRAAYVQRAEKRAIPMTPMRARKVVSLSDPVSAAMRASLPSVETRRRAGAR
jgi:SAM-dependent methyltransferase